MKFNDQKCLTIVAKPFAKRLDDGHRIFARRSASDIKDSQEHKFVLRNAEAFARVSARRGFGDDRKRHFADWNRRIGGNGVDSERTISPHFVDGAENAKPIGAKRRELPGPFRDIIISVEMPVRIETDDILNLVGVGEDEIGAICPLPASRVRSDARQALGHVEDMELERNAAALNRFGQITRGNAQPADRAERAIDVEAERLLQNIFDRRLAPKEERDAWAKPALLASAGEPMLTTGFGIEIKRSTNIGI
ncbi:MAG: hypothetical protein U1E20_06070 [Methylocystis sp.]|uniref:hypothetical protein n=1 Tax=Methylocystis sp. TaxID=1911079 RepID=UPI00392C8F8F